MDMDSEKKPLKQFALKVAVGLSLFIVFINIVLPDFSALNKSISNALGKEKNKIILLSFIQNPVALYKLSEFDEKDGKTAKAIQEVELAIGLLEMHGASSATISKYQERISYLKSIDKPTE